MFPFPKSFWIPLAFFITLLSSATLSVHAGKHLFILSGQSNMQRLDPKVSFTPAVEAEFGSDNVIVVKLAQKGQPIRRWFKDWKSEGGQPPEKAAGDLYDQLIKSVKAAIEGQPIATVTFVWSQGERDAKENHGEVYADSFRGLIKQLKSDLGRDDINFVIARLNAPDNKKKTPHWAVVREAQMALADETPRGAWINTDDLGTKIHYTKEAYVEIGKRLAEKAIELIKTQKP